MGPRAMSARHVAALILLLCGGCATVGVAGGRKQLGGELSEPVGFIILQGSSPPGQAQRLEEALGRELQRRGIAARFTVMPGLETSREIALEAASGDNPGLVMLEPSSATEYDVYA